MSTSREPNKKEANGYWGKAEWVALHCKATTYEPWMAKSFKMYVYSLVDILPCARCRDHWKKNLATYPIDDYLGSNDDLFLWTYLIHDIVNKSIGKRSPPFDQVKERYYSALRTCKSCRAM